VNRAVFAPISSGGRAEAVAQKIADAIVLGLLHDGEQLPAETDLAAQFGVSTVTLREALASLRQQGLVETRRGRRGGSFVRRLHGTTTAGLQNRLRQLSASELRDLGDEHRAIASTSAQLAADRASDTDVERLQGHVDALREARSTAEQVRADSRFHIEVAVVSRSERLTRREVALQSESAEMLWLTKPRPMDVEEVAAAHEAILAAIVAEDSEQARRLAEEHVAKNTHRLIDLYLQLTED
jgi:DNA-binding FadR family transcriptional regulator